MKKFYFYFLLVAAQTQCMEQKTAFGFWNTRTRNEKEGSETLIARILHSQKIDSVKLVSKIQTHNWNISIELKKQKELLKNFQIKGPLEADTIQKDSNGILPITFSHTIKDKTETFFLSPLKNESENFQKGKIIARGSEINCILYTHSIFFFLQEGTKKEKDFAALILPKIKISGEIPDLEKEKS